MKEALIAGVALLSAVAGLTAPARANVIAYDGFNTSSISNGTALSGATVNDVSGWNGQWTTTGTSGTLTNGETYAQATPPATYAVSGQAATFATQSGQIDFRSIATASEISNTAGNVLWVSFLQTNAGANNKAQLSLYSGATDVADMGTGGGGYLGASTGSPSFTFNTAMLNAANTTYLLVGELSYTSASTGTLRFWVDPDFTASDPGSPLITVNLSSALTVTQIRLFDSTSGGTGGSTFDEIRLGTNYGDVVNSVPEPAILGLLAPAALVLATRRRHKQLA